MYVVQLIGRAADSVVDMPYHVAQSNIINGTVRLATEAEVIAAGIDIHVEAPLLVSDAGVPEGYRIEPTGFGGFDLFESGGIRLNSEPYVNMAAARSAALSALEMHVAPFRPIEEVLSPEMLASQMALRPARTWTTADYTAEPAGPEPGDGFHVFDTGGVKLTEEPVPDLESAKKFAADHLALMIAQGEGPEGTGPDSEDEEIVVPPDWVDAHHMTVKALARRISGEEPANLAAAKAVIEDYQRRMAS